jgi:hypothetical protein
MSQFFVNYGIIQYEVDKKQQKQMFVHFLDLCCTSQLKFFAVRLVGKENSRDEALDIRASQLFLVKTKHLNTTTNLTQHIPEAVSQAFVLTELTQCGILPHEPDTALLISPIQAITSSFLFVQWMCMDICDPGER